MTDRSGVFLNSALGTTLGGGGGSLLFTTITNGQTAASNNGYVCNFSTSQVLTLPTSPTVGDVIQVDSIGTGITQVQCGNASHSMYNWTTTIAAMGLLLLSQYETATLRYVATNKWIVEANVGTLTTASTLVDPFFNDVTFLLPGNGVSTDYSGNGLNVTNNNVTFNSTYTKFTANSMAFNGTTAYLTVATPGTATKFSGDFTIETWVYLTNLGAVNTIIDCENGTGTGPNLFIQTNGSVYAQGIGINFGTPAATVVTGQWYHLAWTRQGSTVTIWVNGQNKASATVTTNFADGNLFIGRYVLSGSSWLFGYLAHFRITNGVCRYSANFTVPQTTFSQQADTTADPVWNRVNWMPRAASSNTGTDVSGNALALTLNGTTTSNSLPNQDAYYWVFNGSSNRVTATGTYALPAGTGDFCIDVNVYPTTTGAASGSCIIGSSTASAFHLRQNTGAYTVSLLPFGGSVAVTSAAMTQNAWNRITCVRVGGVSVIYLNGVPGTSAADANSYAVAATACIGGTGSAGYYFTGNLDGVRSSFMPRNSANFASAALPYTAPFPLALPAAYDPFWQDTILLLRGAGSNAVTDVSGNALTLTKTGITTGTSTPTPQQDSYWIDFSGSSYITAPTAAASYTIGDFQFETWVYISGYPGSQYGLIDTGSDAGFRVKITSTGTVIIENGGGAVLTTSATVGLSGWHHVAAGRQGTTYYVAIDGAQATPVVNATAVKIGTVCFIGEYYDTNWKLTGKLAGTRLSLTCRYTANFTAPTSPFLTVGAT